MGKLSATGGLVLVLTFAVAIDIAIRLGFFESASDSVVDGAHIISTEPGDSVDLELRTLDSSRLDERSIDSGRVRFNHIGIIVTDLDRSIEFYKNQLGFDLLSRQRSKGSSWELAFLAAGDGEPVLELQQYIRGDGKAPTGFSHVGVFVCDVNSFYDTSPVPGGAWQGDVFETKIAQMRFMTDPDGYRVEVMGYLKSKGADLELAVGSNEHCEERLFFHKVDD